VDVSSSVARVATRRARYQVSWILALPYPLRNMLRRWRGMLGMILGVGIALGIGMTMLAVSSAIIAIFTADYRRSGADLYVVTEGGTLIALLPGDSPGTIDRGRHTLAQIRALPGVSAAIGAMNWTMERNREGPRRRDETAELIAVMGIDGDPALVPNVLSLQAGRWLRRSDEVVIGSKLGREKALELGRPLRLNGRDFTIVGIGKLRGFGFATDAVAYMDMQAFRLRADVGDVFNVIAVDTDRAAETRQRILELESLTVFDPDELVRLAEEANATSAMLRSILSLLTLSIAALFVSNMLGRSVAERRLEFATLRAIGIPTRTILLTVAGEAFLVSVAAGVVGIGISQLIGALLNGLVAPPYGFETLYVADLQLFGTIFALALGLGLLAGLFPARSATRVDPVDVLREA
jgi:putative ABC transport system permease protein